MVAIGVTTYAKRKRNKADGTKKAKMERNEKVEIEEKREK